MNIFNGKLVGTTFVTVMLVLMFGDILRPQAGLARHYTHRRAKQVLSYTDEYDWVHPDKAGFPTGHQYPAPSGEEDKELLPETWHLVNDCLDGFQTEDGITSERHDGNKSFTGMPDWWFSQCIGADPASGGVHTADMINVGPDASLEQNYFDPSHNWVSRNGGSNRKYGAAFDIVIGDVHIFNQPIHLEYFDPYIIRLRDGGIIAWGRWVGEVRGKTDMENEMHCIDPASPFIKSKLQTQIVGKWGFMNQKWGEEDYTNDLPQATPAQWQVWLQNVRDRQVGVGEEIGVPKIQWLADQNHHPGIRGWTDLGPAATPLLSLSDH